MTDWTSPLVKKLASMPLGEASSVIKLALIDSYECLFFTRKSNISETILILKRLPFLPASVYSLIDFMSSSCESL
jgi:hypothetical protein